MWYRGVAFMRLHPARRRPIALSACCAWFGCSAFVTLVTLTPSAWAEEPEPEPARLSPSTPAQQARLTPPEDPRNTPWDRIVALREPTGRIVPRPLDADEPFRFELDGEFQLRAQFQRAFLLEPTTKDLGENPQLTGRSLGQKAFVTGWLRATPRVRIGPNVVVTGQIDFPTGFVFGDTTRGVGADSAPRDNGGNLGNYLVPRWLYVDWRTKVGLLRVGQQPNHWGMGILANDGDHPNLFGDYRYGQMAERVLFGTRPFGEKSPFTVALAADLVYRDNQARLSRGDVAFQGVLAAYYEKGPNQVGLFAVARDQRNTKDSVPGVSEYRDRLQILALDVAAHGALPLPGHRTGFAFGEVEAAAIFGRTNLLRDADTANDAWPTRIASQALAARVGFVRGGTTLVDDVAPEPAAPGVTPKRISQMYGSFVTQVEVGYASGDANPYDRTERRFTFDPNHKVGLVLFDEVLRWHTARAATAAADPLLTNGARPTPGVDLLPSNGGVFGAAYMNPTAIFRPEPWLDLKAGALFAQTTADLVSPYGVATKGKYTNYRGGDPRSHDLGVELDLGVEARHRLPSGIVFQGGAQAGVLFPGRALADANGTLPAPTWVAVGRTGLQF